MRVWWGGRATPPCARARTHALHSSLLYLSKTFQGDLRERRLDASRVNQQRCQATGKLLFCPYTGQLGARIPSLPVRCHKPFIGRTAASLKNTSIKARRPPTSPGPKEGFKEGRGEEESSLESLRRLSLPVPSLHSLGRGGESLLGGCLSSWGLPLIGTPCPGPERRGSSPSRTILTLFL